MDWSSNLYNRNEFRYAMIFTLPRVFANEYKRLRIQGDHVGVRRVWRVQEMEHPLRSLHGKMQLQREKNCAAKLYGRTTRKRSFVLRGLGNVHAKLVQLLSRLT